MRNGFKFKEKHSSEFGITVRTKSRPIRPEVKSFGVDLPCRDGSYDFSKSNPAGREYFYERVISVSVSVAADELLSLQNKLSRLAVWFTGGGELIFDDMPYTVWYGQVFDEIVYLPEHGGKSAVIDVSFRVKPFGSCAVSTDGPHIGFAMPLGTNIPIGIDAYLQGSFEGKGDVQVLNFGDRPIRPVIKLSGGVGNIIMKTGGKTLSFSASEEVMIDCENQIVSDNNGYIAVSGEFFELAPGRNTISFENSNILEVDVDVSYVPEFTYAADFEAIDWSDADA